MESEADLSNALARYTVSGCLIGSIQFHRGELLFHESCVEMYLGDDENTFTTALVLSYDRMRRFQLRTTTSIIRIECPLDIVESWASRNGFSLDSSQQEAIGIVTVLDLADIEHFSAFVGPMLNQAHHERSCSNMSARSATSAAASVLRHQSHAHPGSVVAAPPDGIPAAPSSVTPPTPSVAAQHAPRCDTPESPAAPSVEVSAISPPRESSVCSSPQTARKQQKGGSTPLQQRGPERASPEMAAAASLDKTKSARIQAPANRDEDEDNVTIGAIVQQRRKKARLERPVEALSPGAGYDFMSVFVEDKLASSSKTNKPAPPAPSPLYFTKRPTTHHTTKADTAPSNNQTKKSKVGLKSKPAKKTAQPPTKISTLTAPEAGARKAIGDDDPSAVPNPPGVSIAVLPADEYVVRSPTFLHRPDVLVMPTPRHHGGSGQTFRGARDEERQQIVELKSLLDGGLDDDNFDCLLKHVATMAKAKREAKVRREKSRMQIEGGEVARCVSQLLSRFAQESQARRQQVQLYYSKRYDDTISGILACKEALASMQEKLSSVTATVDKTMESLTCIKDRMQLDMQRWDAAELMDCTAATASIQQKLLQLH